MTIAKTYAVRRDANTTIITQLPDYELKILSFIFGKENVTALDREPVEIERDPAVEPARLAAKYGEKTLMQIFGAEYEEPLAAAVAASSGASRKRAKSSQAAES